MDYDHPLKAAGIVVSGALFYSLTYGWFEADDPRRRPLWIGVLGLARGEDRLSAILDRERSTVKSRDDAGR